VSVQGVRVLAAAGRKFHRTEFDGAELNANSKRHIGHTHTPVYAISLLFTLASGRFDYDLHLEQYYRNGINASTRNVEKTSTGDDDLRTPQENCCNDENIIIMTVYNVAFGIVAACVLCARAHHPHAPNNVFALSIPDGRSGRSRTIRMQRASCTDFRKRGNRLQCFTVLI